ncbi:MAG: hypothetical protein P4L57_15095 [Rhizomicrobium sp.]|nr:hypothetical protein [Rhizomicrobium sp.]
MKLSPIALCLTLLAIPCRAESETNNPSNVGGLPTSALLVWCDEYVKSDGSAPAIAKSDLAAYCILFFNGWTESYAVGAGGKRSDGTPVYDICEHDKYSPDMFARAFAAFAHTYSAQFKAGPLTNSTFAIPYALHWTWPCTKK